jgi:hypothetical protein
MAEENVFIKKLIEAPNTKLSNVGTSQLNWQRDISGITRKK